MKVAYLLKRYPRFSETFVVSELLAHEAAGLDVTIFALRPPTDTHFQDIIARVNAPVYYLTGKELRSVEFWPTLQQVSLALPDIWENLALAKGENTQEVLQALQLACRLRIEGFTHIHAHFATSATTVARLASHFTGIPYSFTAHAKDIFHEDVRPDDLHRKLREAAAVVTVSHYNLNFLRQHYGTAIAPLHCIYNGLDLSGFPFQSPQERPLSIVAVGRLVGKKGFRDLIQACAHLREQGQPFTCDIIGMGELRESLAAQIQALKLGDQVRLVGPKPQAAVIEAVQSAALLVAPCVVGNDGNQDGLPTVLLEAMALGTPCISTDVTGIPELVCDRITGLQVPQHQPQALANAIALLLNDGDLRHQLAIAARQKIETEFDIHRNSARQRQLFQTLAVPPSMPLPPRDRPVEPKIQSPNVQSSNCQEVNPCV